MMFWFGKGCKFQCCQWEENEIMGGPDFKNNEPVLVFCSHENNPDPYGGNCSEKYCPLKIS